MNTTPHFGQLPLNVYFTQGYSGHGVALSSLAGQLIAETLARTAQRFDVFATLPAPSFQGGTLPRSPGLVAGMLCYAPRDKM